MCFYASNLRCQVWPPGHPVSILPVCISRMQSLHHLLGQSEHWQWTRLVSTGTREILSSWYIMQPDCTPESHPGSVAVDLGQTSPSPSASWRLKMLQLITVNGIIVHLPQCYTPKHKPPREADVWDWAAPAAQSISEMHPCFECHWKVW